MGGGERDMYIFFMPLIYKHDDTLFLDLALFLPS